jgi:hypothetical protein
MPIEKKGLQNVVTKHTRTDAGYLVMRSQDSSCWRLKAGISGFSRVSRNFSGALQHHPAKSIFASLVTAWNKTDRWFMEVTQSKIINGKLRCTCCKANSLEAVCKTVHYQPMRHVTDYMETDLPSSESRQHLMYIMYFTNLNIIM